MTNQMSKMATGTDVAVRNRKGHSEWCQHPDQPFLTHFQRWLVGEIHEFHGCRHQCPPVGILGDKACQTQPRGASSRSRGPAYTAGSASATFQHPGPFSQQHFCAFKTHSGLGEVHCSESAVHWAEGFYVTYQ